MKTENNVKTFITVGSDGVLSQTTIPTIISQEELGYALEELIMDVPVCSDEGELELHPNMQIIADVSDIKPVARFTLDVLELNFISMSMSNAFRLDYIVMKKDGNVKIVERFPD